MNSFYFVIASFVEVFFLGYLGIVLFFIVVIVYCILDFFLLLFGEKREILEILFVLFLPHLFSPLLSFYQRKMFLRGEFEDTFLLPFVEKGRKINLK